MNNIQTQSVNEDFFIPTNLELVSIIDDIKLYTSQTLKYKFISAIHRTNLSKYSYYIKESIDRNKIVPCFLNKNILSFLKFKISQHEYYESIEKFFNKDPDIYSRSILGFFEPNLNKIFILLDNNINIFTHANLIELEDTLLHECIHYFSFNNPKLFMRTFENDLIKFYKSLYKKIFKIGDQIPDKDILKIINFLLIKFQKINSNFNTQTFSEYSDLLDVMLIKYSDLTKEEFNKIKKYYIAFVKLFFTDFNEFLKLYKKYPLIPKSIEEVYKNNFGLNNLGPIVYVQELCFVSEVECIILPNKIVGSKVKTVLSKI